MVSTLFDFGYSELARADHLKDLVQDRAAPPAWLLHSREPEGEKLLIEPLAEPAQRRASQPRARYDPVWIKKRNRHFGGVRKARSPVTSKRTGMSKSLSVAQYQRHMAHLMMRVLSLRTNASPFTLILDDLNQSAKPLLEELTRRAFSRNVNVVMLSFELHNNSHPAVRYIPVYTYVTGDQILAELGRAMNDHKESLVIVDSLSDLLSEKHIEMGALFDVVAMKYRSTLVGIWHQDLLPVNNPVDAYLPQQLDVVKYMATTIITCRSFAHVLAAKAAKQRSLPEPSHGLLQGAEGVIQSLNSNDHRGIVLDTEFRRKSGRPESASYFLRPACRGDYNDPCPGMVIGTLKQEFVTLLDLVPAYNDTMLAGLVDAAAQELDITFNLSLTDKQKQAREDVVLPYFDAQNTMGQAGEGGRILYDMGSEDDFDEEEDEI